MHNDVDNDSIDFSYYWQAIKIRKKMISCIVGGVTSITIVVSLLLPKYYTASVVIMPISAPVDGGLAALASQMGGLGSLIGLKGGGSIQQFMVFLNSRTLAEQVIEKNNLLPILFPQQPLEALRVDVGAAESLRGHMKFINDKKNGVISITAEFKNPKIAADVANEYVDELQKYINENSVTVSKRNRIFIGKQIEENKRDLLEAGKELSKFYSGNRVSGVESYVDVPVDRSANFKSTHSAFERRGGKESDIKEKLKLEIDRLQKQKMELESVEQHSPSVKPINKVDDDSDLREKEDNFVKNVPQQAYLQYLTLHRSLLVQINTLLTQQFEMAKINEMKDDLAFQVVDSAIIPERCSWPKRTLMVEGAFIISLLASTSFAVFLEKMKKTEKV